MLYIEELDDDLWLHLVEVLGEQQICDMVLCLYPDSEPALFPEPFFDPAEPECLERVTVYPDDSEPPCSGRMRVSSDLTELLSDHAGDFEDWGDSMLLYPPRERQWIAAFVPHQRVALVRDVKLQDFLDAAGFQSSEQPPQGWTGATE